MPINSRQNFSWSSKSRMATRKYTATFCLIFSCLAQSLFLVTVQGKNYVTATVSSLFPAQTCVSSPPPGPGSLPVMSRYGPCSPLGAAPLRSVEEMLINGSQYMVVIGLGTPKVDLVVSIDTGSGFNWVKCSSCGSSCTPYMEFDPSRSTSYRQAQCFDDACRNVSGDYVSPCEAGGICAFDAATKDKGPSGNVGTDTLTIATSSLPSYVFGCASDTSGHMGLSRDHRSSTINQLSVQAFSYCLPSLSRTGHLTFDGYREGGTPLVYIPMLSPVDSYYVNLTALTVAGEPLPNITAYDFAYYGTHMDIGTSYTFLPTDVYTALKERFQELMSGYKEVPPSSTDDVSLCYDFTGVTSVSFPQIGLVLDNVTLLLDYQSTFYAESSSKVCLAFDAQTPTGPPSRIGSVNQRGFEVYYDLYNARIGFGTGTCT